jgi:hypothetical protein
MQSMLPTKRRGITDWLHRTLGDIKALLDVVINMGVHPMSDITDYFSPSMCEQNAIFF